MDADYDTMDEAAHTVFSHFDSPQQEVLIKPNLLGGFPTEQHVTIHPSLVKALVRYCEGENLDITVGDNPAGRGNLMGKAKRTGLYQASQGHFKDISKIYIGCDLLI